MSDGDTDESEQEPEEELEYPSVDELNEQEWTLGNAAQEVREFLGMEWQFSDPEDEYGVTVLLAAIYDPKPPNAQQYRVWVDQIIDAPEVTDERWAAMTPRERAVLGIECMDFFDLESVVDEEVLEDAVDTSNIDGVPDDGREIETEPDAESESESENENENGTR